MLSHSLIFSDAELSGQAQTDPSSISQTHPQGGAEESESMACNLMPHILLSVCGGLGDSGELSCGRSEREGRLYSSGLKAF